MTRKTILSKQYQLSMFDILKGLLMAVLTPALFIVQQSLEKGELTFDWKSIALASVSGGLAYLLKNFFETTRRITIDKK
jgi:hypothetical protein